ncbi:MAG: chemotaxis protein CheD [Gemmatimonadaceae bacterium]|nr:chemotaxis protein CheD [Gemmatimonadaceae bacterium]
MTALAVAPAGLAPLSLARHLVVGMADCKVSRDADETLITYALGSCLGIVLHDPVAGVAGLLHVMLPQSSIDEAKAKANPAMFVDTGVPRLFKACYELGARKERMTVTVAGGAHVAAVEAEDSFQIGKRNLLMLRKLLWKNGVMIHAEDTGGHQRSRTLSVAVGSGAVLLKTNGAVQPLRPDGPASSGREP